MAGSGLVKDLSSALPEPMVRSAPPRPRASNPKPRASSPKSHSVHEQFTTALDSLIERVKEDRSVVAAILGGSLSHDRVWAKSDIDLVVAASKDAIVMVEGGAAEASENDVVEALMFAHRTAQPILELIEKMRAAVGKPKKEFVAKALPEDVKKRVAALVDADLSTATRVTDKKARYDGYSALKKKMGETLLAELGPGQTLVDLPYPETATAAAARRAGARVVDGLDVLVAQGAAAFERWTGVPAPIEVMRAAVGRRT